MQSLMYVQGRFGSDLSLNPTSQHIQSFMYVQGMFGLDGPHGHHQYLMPPPIPLLPLVNPAPPSQLLLGSGQLPAASEQLPAASGQLSASGQPTGAAVGGGTGGGGETGPPPSAPTAPVAGLGGTGGRGGSPLGGTADASAMAKRAFQAAAAAAGNVLGQAPPFAVAYALQLAASDNHVVATVSVTKEIKNYKYSM